jgi:hypothetical protein
VAATHYLHPSGGLIYHWRALCHGGGPWRPYRTAVTAWLQAWRPPAEHLLLLGPSGGYALTRAFLATFRRITAVEPDPLARFILARRFAGLDIHWEPAADDPLLAAQRHPQAAVLFCNLLGQDWLGVGDEATRRLWLEALPTRLAGRSWASFHDVVSTAIAPLQAGPLRDAGSPGLEALLARFWPGGELPLVDHHTHVLSAGRPADYVVWNLAPGHHHLVGWVTSPPHA